MPLAPESVLNYEFFIDNTSLVKMITNQYFMLLIIPFFYIIASGIISFIIRKVFLNKNKNLSKLSYNLILDEMFRSFIIFYYN